MSAVTTIETAMPESVAAPVTAGSVPSARVLRMLLHDRTALLGLSIVVALMLAAALAPVLAPHDPNRILGRQFAPPSPTYPLGTDYLGRDLLSRLLFGARVSIGATVVATTLISAIGLVLGMLAGYLGGLVDTVVSRVVDVLLAFPSLLLALAVTGVLGVGLGHVVLAVVLVWWAGYARIVRGAVLAEREKPYVEAARAVGASERRILRHHLLPNVVAPVVVLTSLDMGAILLGLAGLSFLGLGVRSPTAEWGSMLAEAKAYIGPAPHLMVYPGAAIFLFVLGFNLVGDGLRDVLDPRTRRPGR